METPQTFRSRRSIPGITIPGYDLKRRLATGTFASVFLATGLGDPQPIAVKVIRHDSHRNANDLVRLMREHELLSRLNGRHIVRVFERGFAEDFAYIAMEYCAHGDLWGWLERRSVAPEQVMRILRQIGLGLSVAHSRHVIHRDLKPANVLLRDPKTVALADFGAACDLGLSKMAIGQSKVIGTPAYTSPEVIRCEEVDCRTDLYSAGILLYQMVTGVLPYRAPSLAKIFKAHMQAPIPKLNGQPAVLQPVLDGLLAKDPNDRFQSAEELLAGLEWIAHQQGWPFPPRDDG